MVSVGTKRPGCDGRRAFLSLFLYLADEQFKACELSFGGGATLVFSASSGQGDQIKWVTIIAQLTSTGFRRFWSSR